MRILRPIAIVAAVALFGGCAWIDRSSVSSRPNPIGGNHASARPAVSQSGRYVAFTSGADNLVPGDTNGVEDVFVHDHVTGATERVSVASDGTEGADGSTNATISDDGRYVAFESTSFLVPPTGHFPFGLNFVYVHDRVLGTTTREDFPPAIYLNVMGTNISGNGRIVAFDVFTDGGVSVGPFVRDLAAHTTRQMPGGTDSSSLFGTRSSLSDDGTRITYTMLTAAPPNDQQLLGAFSTVVADTTTASVVATLFTHDVHSLDPFFEVFSAISGDGTKAAVVVDGEGPTTLYRADVANPTLVPILSVITYAGGLALSDTGSVIAFSRGPDYVITNAGGAPPRVVSADIFGRPATSLDGADLSGNGRWIAFGSSDPSLTPGDGNGVSDVFLRSTRSFRSLAGRHPR